MNKAEIVQRAGKKEIVHRADKIVLNTKEIKIINK